MAVTAQFHGRGDVDILNGVMEGNVQKQQRHEYAEEKQGDPQNVDDRMRRLKQGQLHDRDRLYFSPEDGSYGRYSR